MLIINLTTEKVSKLFELNNLKLHYDNFFKNNLDLTKPNCHLLKKICSSENFHIFYITH